MVLADRFAQEIERLDQLASGLTTERAARDALIQSQFILLDAQFVTMIRTVAGRHTRLTVATQPVVDPITTRAFATLAKTVTELSSTLYGPIERLTFTPGLAFVEPEQFGVIRLAWEGTIPAATGMKATALPRMLARGILMQGLPAARLMVSDGVRSERLTAAMLEEALVILFVHGS